jgi:hypothetical protein
MSRTALPAFVAIVFVAIFGMALPAHAQHTAIVTVPTGVQFNIADTSASVVGTPATQVTFSAPIGFTNAEKLRISVQANANTFSGPGNVQIPAGKVSWMATAIGGGTASSGTLTAGTYTLVYVSKANLKANSTGAVAQTWTLNPIAAAGLRAGTHSLTVTWKVESF